jgi:5-methylcytosine-specific restriction endonuclease McrA
MPQIFTKYGKTLRITKYIKDKPTPKTIEFMGLTKIRKDYFIMNRLKPLSANFDPFKIKSFWRTTFKLYSLCCVCGADSNIEMHHINSLKKISNKNRDFNLILQQLNRKQIPVCRPCHVNITNGTYSGKSLKDLFNESLAAL